MGVSGNGPARPQQLVRPTPGRRRDVPRLLPVAEPNRSRGARGLRADMGDGAPLVQPRPGEHQATDAQRGGAGARSAGPVLPGPALARAPASPTTACTTHFFNQSSLSPTIGCTAVRDTPKLYAYVNTINHVPAVQPKPTDKNAAEGIGPIDFGVQGVLYLVDTPADNGAFCKLPTPVFCTRLDTPPPMLCGSQNLPVAQTVFPSSTSASAPGSPASLPTPTRSNRCASLALSPLPFIFSYKSYKSLCGAGPPGPRSDARSGPCGGYGDLAIRAATYLEFQRRRRAPCCPV